MTQRLEWAVHGRDWPGREHSCFVEAAGLRWHVQRAGAAARGLPRLLLVHGTGASTHSWHPMRQRLEERCDWLVPDLPGHGFTAMPAPDRLALPAVAQALAGLLKALDFAPDVAIGHSAGAAIIVRMALDGALPGAVLGAVNGAFLPFGGVAAPVFGPLARMLHGAGWVSRLFARRAADPRVVARLVAGTGSRLDERALALYGRLMRSPGHTSAALAMMAHWDLRGLARELPRLPAPLHLLVGDRDLATPPRQARRVQALVPGATLRMLPGVGHLAHEEAPGEAAAWVLGLRPTVPRASAPRV